METHAIKALTAFFVLFSLSAASIVGVDFGPNAASMGYYQTQAGYYRDRGAYMDQGFGPLDHAFVVSYHLLPMGWNWVGKERRFELGSLINPALYFIADLADNVFAGRDKSGGYTPIKVLLLAPNSTVGVRLMKFVYVGAGLRTSYFIPFHSSGAYRGLIFWPSLLLGLWHQDRNYYGRPDRPSLIGATFLAGKPTFWNFDGDDAAGGWTVSLRLFMTLDPG